MFDKTLIPEWFGAITTFVVLTLFWFFFNAIIPGLIVVVLTLVVYWLRLISSPKASRRDGTAIIVGLTVYLVGTLSFMFEAGAGFILLAAIAAGAVSFLIILFERSALEENDVRDMFRLNIFSGILVCSFCLGLSQAHILLVIISIISVLVFGFMAGFTFEKIQSNSQRG